MAQRGTDKTRLLAPHWAQRNSGTELRGQVTGPRPSRQHRKVGAVGSAISGDLDGLTRLGNAPDALAPSSRRALPYGRCPKRRAQLEGIHPVIVGKIQPLAAAVQPRLRIAQGLLVEPLDLTAALAVEAPYLL